MMVFQEVGRAEVMQMKLTFDQALKQAIAAHSEGNLQDAERLYRAILKAQPKHPDANHNLGVLAVSIGKPIEAIPLFKRAVQANPQAEQFWLSYIDALIKLEHFTDAKQALTDGAQSGVSAEKLSALSKLLQTSSSRSSNKAAPGQTLSEKRAKRAEKKKIKRGKKKAALIDAKPSQELLDCLLGHYQAGGLTEAERLAVSLTQEFPNHPAGWKILGSVYKKTGRVEESLKSMRTTVRLAPQDDEAHYNLGNTLRELGRLDEAEASYRRAIALRPDFIQAHSNLGTTLKGQDRFSEAEASFRRAITLKPSYAEAHYNLGNTLKQAGRLSEAEDSYNQAIKLAPDNVDAISNLGDTLKALGRLEEAKASYERVILLRPDSGHALHMLSAVTGADTAGAPIDYVENLFDGYAAKFDSSLVDQLDYRTPRAIAELIANNSKSDKLGSVLDLGCGTGLFGAEISPNCDRIDGLDISANMLLKAKERGIYDNLVKSDIESYLLNETLSFDYFVAADVFVYIGELTEVFRSIQSRNKSNGRLVFSVEHMDGQGFALRPSGRYAHSKSYIDRLCEKHHYQLEHFETHDLRLDKGSYILGGLYLLSF